MTRLRTADRPHSSSPPQARMMAVAFGIVAWFIAIISTIQGKWYVAVGLMAALFAVAAAHEAGHFLAALATGFGAGHVVIAVGLGPSLRLFGGHLRLGPLPGGWVHVENAHVLSRLQVVGFAFGGIAGNLVLAVALWGINLQHADANWLVTTAIFSFVTALANLVPFASRSSGYGGTDGYQIIRALLAR